MLVNHIWVEIDYHFKKCKNCGKKRLTTVEEGWGIHHDWYDTDGSKIKTDWATKVPCIEK